MGMKVIKKHSTIAWRLSFLSRQERLKERPELELGNTTNKRTVFSSIARRKLSSIIVIGFLAIRMKEGRNTKGDKKPRSRFSKYRPREYAIK